MQRFVYFFLLVFLITLVTASQAAYAQIEQDSQASGAQSGDTQQGETRWVSDDLFTYLRAGPGKDYRLLGSVTAGTKIQLLQVDRDAGYAEIIDDRDRSGWIEIRYVSRTQSIRDDINDANNLLSRKDESVKKMEEEVLAIKATLERSDEQKAKLNRLVSQQLEDIARLNEKLDMRSRENVVLWFTRGAILGVIALLIGYVLGIFGRRRNNSNRLM